MNRTALRPGLWSSVLLGGMLLASCGSPQRATESAPAPMSAENSTGAAASQSAIDPSAQQDSAELAQSAAAPPIMGENGVLVSQVRQAQPQLIKTAELRMRVDSVEETLRSATAIARQQQGDLLDLHDQVPQDGSHRTASLQIRVPQLKLEATLAALSKLGTVQQQSQTAEDVSNQMVDFEARLRNLRKSEETVLKIMERSGNVGDVLKVAQELNNIRGSIEQIDGQLSDLRNRVSYSTISLNLSESIAIAPPQTSTATQLENTWKGATQSIGKLTVDLLQLGIWLMVYSPYLLLLAGGVWGYSRFKRASASKSSEATD